MQGDERQQEEAHTGSWGRRRGDMLYEFAEDGGSKGTSQVKDHSGSKARGKKDAVAGGSEVTTWLEFQEVSGNGWERAVHARPVGCVKGFPHPPF